jgi:pyrroline-5-carboxylate reductase
MEKDINDLASLWLVGCGNMAGAMLSRWLDSGLDPARVTVIRPSGAAVAPGVRVLTALPRDEAPPAMLMIGVKPQKLGEVAGDIAAVAGPDTLVLSILAGATLAGLRARFPDACAIVRAIVNTPVAIGQGAVLLCSDRGDATHDTVTALMTPLGLVEWLEDEKLADLATALAGSGPAFLFRFIDGLARAAAELGLPADQADRLALATVSGAARLAAASDERPAELASRVTSKGGSTLKGLEVLDRDDALVRLLRDMLAASERRNAELAAEAR